MKAAITPHYGTPEVMQIAEVPEPVLADGGLLVQVFASAVTAGDRRLRSADFPGMTAVLGRLALGVTGPRHAIQGTTFAGRVLAVGPAVTGFSVGDDVFGSVDHGSYAERIAVDADGPVAIIPDGFDYAEAAAVPYGASTALYFLRDLAKVQPGEHVLILGASGGVGRYSVQLAKHLGAEVTAVCSRESFECVKSYGADHLVDYRTQDFTSLGQRYDVVFDIADASGFLHCRPVLQERGRYLTLYVSLAVLTAVAWSALVGGPRAVFSIAFGDRERLEDLQRLMGQGVLQPKVVARLPLCRVGAAHTQAEGVRGEVIVLPTIKRLEATRSPSANAVGSRSATSVRRDHWQYLKV